MRSQRDQNDGGALLFGVPRPRSRPRYNVSYMAEQLALFGIVVGIALVLTGIGLILLAYAVFVRGTSEEPQAA